MSSSTSKTSESISDSEHLHEQPPPTDETPSDQLKNGEEPDQIGGRDPEAAAAIDGEGPEEEEEEGECGFCLFMKGGGCKDAFTEWEKCVEEAEKTDEDIVEKCFQVTSNLKKCMEVHSDYYEPILRAEKAAEAEVTKELQDEVKVLSQDPEITEEQLKS